MKKTTERKQSKLPVIASAVLIAALIGSYFVFPEYKEFVKEGYQMLSSGDEQRISAWVGKFDFWGPFVIIAAMIAQMFLIVINVVALMLVAILAYGPFWGSLLAVAAVFTASTVGYWIGRGFGLATVQKIIGQKSEEKVNRAVKKYGFWAVAVARVSPFLSNDAISFAAGIVKMNYWKFMAATALGIVPLTVFIAWLSKDMERLKTGLIWISSVSIGTLVIYIIYNKVKNKNSN